MFTRFSLFRWLIVFTLLALLAACNFPGSAPNEGLPEGSNPPAEPPVSTPSNEQQPPQPATSQEPNPASGGGSDSCLEGVWVMPTDKLDLFFASMFPQTSSFLRVTQGELKLAFDGNAFTYSGDYVLHADTANIPSAQSDDGTYSEAHVMFTVTGTYHLQDHDVIAFEAGQQANLHVVECTSYSPRVGLISVPCDPAMQQTLPLGLAPYTCSATELQLEVQGVATPTLLMFFERKP